MAGPNPNLRIKEDETWALADHSALNARQTFKIPDSNSSQNIKAELEEIWAGGRSYGLFSLVENTGGLHEFMPDPERSQFLPERDLPKMAKEIVVRAKRALMKGIPVKAVLADVKRRIPANPEYQKYFTAAVATIQNVAGLLGTVYIDPSLFSSCAEGLKFMATAKVDPSFVLELTDCSKCVYKCGGSCALFGKRIEARVPWKDREAMKAVLKKAMDRTGVSMEQVLSMRKAGKTVTEIVRSVYTDPEGKQTTQETETRWYEGNETEAPVSTEKTTTDGGDKAVYAAVVVQALNHGIAVEKVAAKLLNRTQSWPLVVAVMKQALTDVGCIKQAQLPCPSCEVLPSSKRGIRLASLLPRTMAITKAGICLKCGRDFSTHINFWNRPFVLPGMAADVIRKQGKRGTQPPQIQGPSQGVIWEPSQVGPIPGLPAPESVEVIPPSVLE